MHPIGFVFLCFEEGAASDKNLTSDFNLVLDLDEDKTEHGGGGVIRSFMINLSG